MKKISAKCRWDLPKGGAKCRWGRYNCVFRMVESDVSGSDASPYRQKLCPSATVVGIYDGALAEEYAVLSTTVVVVEI